MALSLNHQTPQEFAARFWERVRSVYASGDRIEFARMVWWIYGRVQAGDFTNNQVRLTFNAAYGRSLDSTQWSVFVATTILPIRDRYQAMIDQADL
jgi:hypothetical protein